MSDHRSPDSRMPEWAVIPFWSLVLANLVAGVFALVSVGVFYLTPS